MSCPVCLQEGRNSPREYWRHGSKKHWESNVCNGVLYLDENAYVHCKGCGASAPLQKMRLRCNNDRHDFNIPSINGFASAISTSAQMVDSAGLPWLQKAMNYLK